jgi:ParB-like chromosome segregation protein Spo0J
MTIKILGTEELDIDCLVSWPGNARRGDVAAIAESIRANDQYRSIIVRRRPSKPDMIVCGHHVRDALVMAGQSTVRAEIIETDDDTARRIHIADNRLSDLATFDNAALAAQLEAFDGDFTGTGFDLADAEKLFRGGLPEPGDAETGGDEAGRWGVVVEVETEDEQAELLARLMAEGYKVQALIG